MAEQRKIQEEEEKQRIQQEMEENALDTSNQDAEKVRSIPLDVLMKKKMAKVMNEYSYKMNTTSSQHNFNQPAITLTTTIQSNVQNQLDGYR